MRTSIDELNARETSGCIVTTSPSLMERLNETLSTDTVTTGLFECFWAAIAAQISIQYNYRPPIRLPKVLVSLGSTSSFISVYDSFANFLFMRLLAFLCSLTKVNKRFVYLL